MYRIIELTGDKHPVKVAVGRSYTTPREAMTYIEKAIGKIIYWEEDDSHPDFYDLFVATKKDALRGRVLAIEPIV
jgi:hypothetical protein